MIGVSFTLYNPLRKNKTLKSNTDTSICATSNEWYFSICFVPTKKLSTQSRVQSRHFTAFLYPVFFTHLSGRGRRENGHTWYPSTNNASLTLVLGLIMVFRAQIRIGKKGYLGYYPECVSFIFWKNLGLHNLLSRFTDL
jgi:hypothetical protein